MSNALTRRQALAAAGAGTAALYAPSLLAQTPEAVKLALEFRIYGDNAPSFHAMISSAQNSASAHLMRARKSCLHFLPATKSIRNPYNASQST